MVFPGKMVPMAAMEPLVRLVARDSRVHRDLQAPTAFLARLEPRALLGASETRDLPDRTDLRVTKELKALWARRDPPAPRD